MLAQQIVSGLAAGSLYALAALGLVLVYKTSHLVNFALGEMAMVSTFVAFTAYTRLGLPYPVAFVVALVFAALLGMAVERFLLRRIQDAPVLSLVVVTLGLGVILYAVAGWLWGYDTKTFPTPISGTPIIIPTGESVVIFTRINLLIFGVAVGLMLLLWWFFNRTLWGTAVRASVQNKTAAQLMGVSPNRVSSLTWAIASMLGAITGMLIAPLTFLDPNMMAEVVLKAFAAAVLGGFTSLPGAIIGGLAIGVLDNLVAEFFGTQLKATAAFLIIVLILAVRPTGLFGERN